MLKVLINAYACSPNWGSEQGMGWHWSIELAKYCKVIVITEGEYRREIENALESLPQRGNLQFVYNNVTDKVRRMCWNQGDWRFYWYYRKWQKTTLNIAERICSEQKIDIIHQLNLLCFREPGLLWKIKGPIFVWGPVGGMSEIPFSYLESAPFKTKLFFYVKNTINRLQYKYQHNVKEAARNAEILLSSTSAEQKVFEKLYHKESCLVNETGCDIARVSHQWDGLENRTLRLLWVAKLDFRKQLGIAIQTMSLLKDLDIHLDIVGTGSSLEGYKEMAKGLFVEDKCTFYGKMDNEKVLEMMNKADLFFFTSIHEATSTVILEAIGSGLPVVCFDTCGFGHIVDESMGRKIKLSNPIKSAQDFATVIKDLYYHRQVLPNMSNACREKQNKLSWEYKVSEVVRMYQKLLEAKVVDR